MSFMLALGTTATVYGDDLADIGRTTVNEDSTTVEGYQTFAMISALGSFQNNDVIRTTASDITDSSAKLRWTSEERYSRYDVYRFSIEENGFVKFATTSKCNINLKNLDAGTSYKFMVRAVDKENALGTVCFDTLRLCPVVSESDTGCDYVRLSLSGISEGAAVSIYRGSEASALEKIATVSAAGSFTDKSVKQGRTYYYQIKAVDFEGYEYSSEIISVKTPVNMGLPKVSGRTKTYAYYTAVTKRGSAQYKLLNSKECYTDEKTGIRMVDGCYCAALGSFYGSKMGTKYKITLSTGKSFKIILCDQKADRHTDPNNQYTRRNKDMVEFYVQKSKIPSRVRGDYGVLDQFKGDIVKIEKF